MLGDGRSQQTPAKNIGQNPTVCTTAQTGATTTRADVSLVLEPERVGRVLVLVIALLTAASLATSLVGLVAGHGRLLGLTRLLNLNEEANLPTFFAGLQLLAGAAACALVAAKTARRGEPLVRQWWLLCGLLVLMAIDEVSEVHESAGLLAQSWFPQAGYGAWALLVAPVAVVVGLLFVPFLWRLPTSTRVGYLLAGSVFLLGAVAVEFLEGLAADRVGRQSLPYVLSYHLQEVMELVAVALFVVVTLRHARSVGARLSLRVG